MNKFLLGAGASEDDLLGCAAADLFDRAIGPDGRVLDGTENPGRAYLSSGHPIGRRR